MALPGAEFKIYRSDGSILETAIADHNGKVTIKKPEAGTYTVKETKAPEGYYLSSETFYITVGEGGIKGNYEIVNTPYANVVIKKRDAETGKPISGVRLEILDSDNNIVSSEMTNDEGSISFKAPHIGVYHIKEVEAPKGYQKLTSTYEFSIQENGEITGTTTLFNSKIQKIGKVMASYSSGLAGRGMVSFGSPNTPRTGDDTPIMLYVILLILSMAAMAGTGIKYFWKGKKRKRDTLLSLLLLAVVMSVSNLYTETAYAAQEKPAIATLSNADKVEIERIQGREILKVQSEPQVDESKLAKPEATYQYEGKEYKLKEYKVIETQISAREELVSDTITYDSVEQADRIPDSAVIEARDHLTGAVTNVTVPLKSYEYSDYRWVNGFQFLITVESADADSFALGDVLIPNQEEHPFKGYEKELLQLIHVSPDFYRILSAEWTGQPWMGENGIIYRQALAQGEKRIADVKAVYEGLVLMDAVPASATEAIYEAIPDADETDLGEPVDKTEQTVKLSLRDKLNAFIQWLAAHPIALAAGGLALIVIIWLVVIILQILASKKKEEEEND